MNISELFSMLNRQGIKLKLDGNDLAATLPKSKVNPDLLNELREKKAEIIKFLQNYVQVQEEFISIEPVEKKEYYPLSSAQKRLYILQQMSPDSTAYNMPSLIPIQTTFDLKKIEIIFKKLIMQHESFRTSFRIVNNTTAQVVHEHNEVEFNLGLYELKDTDDCLKRFIRPFDLSVPPLIRAALIKDADKLFFLIVDMHHIISDGVSQDIIIRDFRSLYADEDLPPLRIHYKDFSQWQNGEGEKENIKQQEDYWLKEFAGEIPVLELPIDFPRPVEQSLEGNIVNSEISPEETRALNAVALNGGATLFMILTAVLNILLSKLSNREDIVIGTPVAGRMHADLENIIGMFVNTLLLRNYPASDRTFKDFLGEVKERTLTAFKNQGYPFEELVDKVVSGRDMGRNPLFDVIFALQNAKTVERVWGPQVQTDSLDSLKNIFHPAKFDLTLTVIERTGGLFLSFLYCIKLFKQETVDRFMGYFKKIVSIAIKYPGIRIGEIDMLSEEEKKQVLNDFNNTEVEYPEDMTIHRLFEEQVEKTPDKIAVFSHGRIRTARTNTNINLGAGSQTCPITLTYNELNEQSTCLAELLIEKGVLPNSIVGIMIERSVEMIIGIMGILKSGCAYMAIDPELPGERIDYMLKDSGAKLLVVANNQEGEKVRRWEGEKVLLESIIYDINHLKGHPRRGLHHLKQLAYVIYTSGSTGRPKGTLVEHHSLVNLCNWHNRYYNVTGKDRSAQFAAAGFDAAVWEIFPYLVKGVVIHIVGDELKIDIKRLAQYYRKNHITITFLPTQFCRQFMEEISDLPLLRVLLTGGDKLDRFFPRPYRLYNNYGPTENCVVTTVFPVESYRDNIPIGKPVDNERIYILSKYKLRLQPIGIPGELCISGAGVARGYLNQPELTSEKFDQHLWDYKDNLDKKNKSFSGGQGGRLFKKAPLVYRTGDLARWLPDGNIEFLGRIDNQVKIRGFRIELGEIENRLSRSPGIKEAVVLAQEESEGSKYLCAYFVSHGEHRISELREFLAKELPDYMIPSHFVQVEKMPLTPNGKIDRAALRKAEGKNLRENVGYIPPSNTVEEELVEVWETVLGRNDIGINENFFMLGGDSIKAIQVTSRMSSAGYKLEMRNLFKYPVISELAPHVTKLKHIADQSVVTGTIPLTPIQESFFKEDYIDRHHFNQAVMLCPEKAEKEFDEEMIKAVFGKIQEHHDALRIVYEQNPETGEILQINRGIDFPLSLETYDIRGRKNASKLLDKKANQIQGSIDLEKGPLMKLGLFHTDNGDRLLIAVHHLVIDGVSWRILFEDIKTLIGQYKRGEDFILSLKTDSFKRWSEKLSEYAGSKILMKEKRYWEGLESDGAPQIPKDIEADKPQIRNTGNEQVFLSEEETGYLLTKVNHAYKTEINDILLTALGLGVKKIFGMERVSVALEGHGREEIMEEIEINRTVGWFTSVYPVILDISPRDLSRQIKGIKETLRRIPNKGIGYGILKYLTGKTIGEENKKGIGFKLKPEISFNYLGQFDTDVKQQSLSAGEGNSFFEITGEPAGNIQSLNNHLEYLIDVNGMITGNRLFMSFSYSTKHFEQETIRALATSFQSELKRIISFCSSRVETQRTPGDFTYKDLSIESVDLLLKEYPGIEDLYMLTPMQEGMLYHALIDRSSLSNLEQTSYSLEGELDISLVERSLNELSKRHDVLRTAFAYKDIGSPVQVVLKERGIDFYYEDISNGTEPGEKKNIIKEFRVKHKERGFDLSKDPLMRVSILRTGNSEYELIWTFHHILMDGWCLGILNREFFEIYNSYKENRPYRLPRVLPYRSYILWLRDRDREESGRYWASYLESFEEQTRIPKIKTTDQNETQVRYKNESLTVVFDAEKVRRLNRLAMKNNVTVNTFMQVIWGILLGKYNRKEDVVFGVVVSGRPPGLKGVESMVGLFINNIPVRIRFEERMRFDRLIQKIQEETATAESHHYYPLVEIQAANILKQNLFNHLFIFENYPIEEQLEKSGAGGEQDNTFRVLNVDVFEQINYDFNVIVSVLGEMGVQFRYNGNLYSREFVDQVGNHLIMVMDQVIENVGVEVGKLEYLSPEEKQRLLYDFNNYNIYIVGMYGTLQPVGVTGELCIGKDNPITGNLPLQGMRLNPDTLYKTGNLARWLPDGNIEYIGRVDNQAKIQDRRIEPGEITYSPPATEIERMIAGIWEHLLDLERISIHDNFFELGGNSLTTIRLTSRIKELGFNVSLLDVIENPTIHMISSIISEKNSHTKSAADLYEENVLGKLECIEKLNKGRNGKNIFIVHPANGMVSQYKQLSVLLEQDYNVYGIQARGLKPGTKMPESPGQMVKDYLEQILSVQEQGPYIIGGYCTGVAVAYEIVIRLERLKQPVEKLILFNSAAYFTDRFTRKIKNLEHLPWFMRKWISSSVDRKCKKAIRTKSSLKIDERNGRDIIVDDELFKEKFKKHMVILGNYFLPLKIVNTPILVPLIEKEFGPGADEVAFSKMTRGKVTVVPIPGDHNSIWQKPHVEVLAEVIKNNLSGGSTSNRR